MSEKAEDIVEEIHSQWDTIDTVLIGFMKEGFYPLNTPLYEMPVLTPEALTHYHPDQYATLQARMEGWKSYTDSRLAIICGGILQYENEMEDIGVMMREQIRVACENTKEKKPSDERMKDMIKSSPRYRQIRLEHQRLQQGKLLMEAHLNRLGRGLALLSRNIERKKLEMGQSRGAY